MWPADVVETAAGGTSSTEASGVSCTVSSTGNEDEEGSAPAIAELAASIEAADVLVDNGGGTNGVAEVERRPSDSERCRVGGGLRTVGPSAAVGTMSEPGACVAAAGRVRGGIIDGLDEEDNSLDRMGRCIGDAWKIATLVVMTTVDEGEAESTSRTWMLTFCTIASLTSSKENSTVSSTSPPLGTVILNSHN